MSKTKKSSGSKLMKTVQLALLSAIIVVMAYTPIGYLRTGTVEITFITVPVIVGAIVLGPSAGAFLGAVFGVTSFLQCFGMSPFGAALLGISPLYTFIVCIPTRILMGWFCGLIFKALNKKSKNSKVWKLSISSLCGALLNTLFFVGAFIALFRNTDYFAQLSAGKNLLAFIVAFVGINGLIEAGVCFVVATAVAKALLVMNKKMRI